MPIEKTDIAFPCVLHAGAMCSYKCALEPILNALSMENLSIVRYHQWMNPMRRSWNKWILKILKFSNDISNEPDRKNTIIHCMHKSVGPSSTLLWFAWSSLSCRSSQTCFYRSGPYSTDLLPFILPSFFIHSSIHFAKAIKKKLEYESLRERHWIP